mgnify:CR=1 FL=1
MSLNRLMAATPGSGAAGGVIPLDEHGHVQIPVLQYSSVRLWYDPVDQLW